MPQRNEGFTLIEIIVTLVILGVLASVAVSKYIELGELARIKTARASLGEVQARLNLVFGEMLLEGRMPKAGQRVSTLYSTEYVKTLPTQANGSNYFMGLADSGGGGSQDGTIGGWRVEMPGNDRNSLLTMCVEKIAYPIKAMISPQKDAFLFMRGQSVSGSYDNLIDATRYSSEFVLYMPTCHTND